MSMVAIMWSRLQSVIGGRHVSKLLPFAYEKLPHIQKLVLCTIQTLFTSARRYRVIKSLNLGGGWFWWGCSASLKQRYQILMYYKRWNIFCYWPKFFDIFSESNTECYRCHGSLYFNKLQMFKINRVQHLWSYKKTLVVHAVKRGVTDITSALRPGATFKCGTYGSGTSISDQVHMHFASPNNYRPTFPTIICHRVSVYNGSHSDNTIRTTCS